MADRRFGLWLIGALGGVGSTVALGLAALRRGLTDTNALVTALPQFGPLNLDEPSQFVLGGHDIRRGTIGESVQALARGSAVFDPAVVAACAPDLESWTGNIRPGTVLNSGPTIAALANRADLQTTHSPRQAITQLKKDLDEFRTQNRLDAVVVVNVASSEPRFADMPEHRTLDQLVERLDKPDILPVSSIYAYAALDSGLPYVNFTPSTGANLGALIELASRRGSAVAGQDGKTGETLVKSVLAPMFADRNMRILSWVGHNILGNRDGQVLNDPENKAAKVQAKDRLVAGILGYSPQTHTSIEYIASLDDWKTAWDHIHFQGFLGVKMAMQFTWQGCDSVLAAPLVIDLARLALFAQRNRDAGILKHLACFFKTPMGVGEHGLARQMEMLDDYVKAHSAAR